MSTAMLRVSAEVDELIEVLRDLPEPEWDRETACRGFRVRDVAGHLILARAPLDRRTFFALFKSPATFTAIAGAASVEHADAHSPAELLAGLEEAARKPRAGFLATVDPAANMLADHATHLQDVRVGLGRRQPPDPERARAVLEAAVRLWRPVTWGTRERAQGLRLVATDIGWEHGDGPEVIGPYDGILLALGGRPAGLELLDGPGLPLLASRMPAQAPQEDAV